MSESSRRRIALVCYAVSVVLSVPHALPGGGVLDLGWIFVWLVPAALMVGLAGLAPRRAAWLAFWTSLAAHVVLFHWFVVVTVTYGKMPLLLGSLAPLAPALYVSLFTAAFAAAWCALRRAGRDSILLGAATWVLFDWVRAHFLGGFPWATLGYSLHLDWPLLGWTRIGGVYVLSFVAAAGGVAIARCVESWSESNQRTLLVSAGSILLAHGVGVVLGMPRAESAESVRIAAVQGNIDQGVKWDADRRERILATYFDLSEQAIDAGAEWIVWPETAVPGLLEADRALVARMGLLARRGDVALVVGAMGIEPDETGRRIGAFFDSAFVFDREGDLRDRYDKTHLVPFGEFVPLRGLLGHFFESLATGLASTDVTAGARPRLVGLTTRAEDGTPISVAVPICYELIFPHLVRRFGAEGAGVLLAITNDAWYGRTGAPHQFLAMTAMRAAENGRWLVRSANTGISAIVDDRGRVLEQSKLFEEAVLVADVPVVLLDEPTFYARFGDVFALVCAIGALAAVGRSVYGQPSRGGQDGARAASEGTSE